MLDDLFEMFQEYADRLAVSKDGHAVSMTIYQDLSGKFTLYTSKGNDTLYRFRNLADAANTFRKFVKEL